jgi:hypothetical protein
VNRAAVAAQVLAAFPGVSHAQLDRMLSGAMPDDEIEIVVRSWNDAKVVPGPDAWTVFLNILKASADIANLIIPIEGAVQGVINIGHG